MTLGRDLVSQCDPARRDVLKDQAVTQKEKASCVEQVPWFGNCHMNIVQRKKSDKK